MKSPTERPDPTDLLKEFVASGRSEAAFAKIVENFGGLVFSSAHRRTGDAGLAEEVTQNVFAILARKAESLQRHLSLTAWIFETTRLEASTAMRSERRHRRKLAALAEQPESQRAVSAERTDPDAAWTDAVPVLDEVLDRLPGKDRDIIFERFYEGKKFREIADDSGQSESACKMRVKRALEKVSRLLTRRGVALSATGIASYLGTELARSAPAATTASVAPNALAASASLPTATVVANTLQTMGTTKTVTLTTATVIAVAAIPFSVQHAEGSRLKEQIVADIDPQPAPMARPVSALEPGNGRGRARITGPRTASALLADLERPMTPRQLLKSLFDSSGSPDTLGERVVLARLANLSREEYDELLKALPEFPSDNATKSLLRKKITSYAPEMSPREQLDRLLASGVKTIVSDTYMRDWATSEPEAALAWYREKQNSGELYGGGLDSSVQKHFFEMLLLGLAKSRPEQALDLYLGAPESDLGRNARFHLTGGLTQAMMRTGNEAPLVALISSTPAARRGEILRKVFLEHGGAGRFDEGLAFIERHDPDPERRNGHIQQMVKDLSLGNVASGFDWVVGTTPEAEAPAFVRQIVSARPYGCREWIESQPPGAIRDHGYAGLIDRLLKFDNFDEARNDAANIGDPALRAATFETIDRMAAE